MPLIREPNSPDMDALYAAIAAVHRGLDAEASAALNARLVLILANHIGDAAVIGEALRIATSPASLPAQ